MGNKESWNMPDGKPHTNNPDSPVWSAYQKFVKHKTEEPVHAMIVNGPHPDYAAFLAGFLAAWHKCQKILKDNIRPEWLSDLDKIWTEEV